MAWKRSKIVCTLGPSSRSDGDIEALIAAGMDVVRLSFAHGSHREHAQLIARIRQISQQLRVPVPILQDLSGPKLRIGEFGCPGVELSAGSKFVLTTREIMGDVNKVSITFPSLVRDLNDGDILLLSDGEIELLVTSTTETDIVCEVVIGGILSSNKGINAPGILLKQALPTSKDVEDLIFGIEHGVDWVAQSFVRTADELKSLRKISRENGGEIPIMAKLEKREALDHLDAIIDEADGIMIARGDLGLEIPIHEIPLVQKEITRAANLAGKPVITATQMLDSMINNPRPTRAEVTDIANAVLDGTDGIMLSGETAVGKYPVQATRMMKDVARVTEEKIDYSQHLKRKSFGLENEISNAIARAACQTALQIGAKVIICFTRSGEMAQLLAKYHPYTPIVVASDSQESLRKTLVFWGTRSLAIKFVSDVNQLIENAKSAVLNSGIGQCGDRVIIVAGTTKEQTELANVIRVEVL